MMLVPQDAIVPKGSSAFVFIADGKLARQVEVSLGRISGNMISVTGDLKAGDKIIVRGNETLTDGREITEGGGRPAGGQRGANQQGGQRSSKSGG